MISDELATMVDPDLLPGVQSNVSVENPTLNLLLRFARFKRENAGDGLRITQLLNSNNTRFYSDFDGASSEATEKHKAHFQGWTNVQGDRVLAGTRLEEVLGKTSKQVLRADSLRSQPAATRNAIIDYVGSETQGAATGIGNTVARAFYGRILPSDNIDRLPVTLDEVFNESGDLHGVSPSGLGPWKTGEHPWATSPPNTDGSTNIHIPQIFHNSGTPRTISKDVLEDGIIPMMAQVSGYWICGLHPFLYKTLKSEWDAQIQIPMGIGMLRFETMGVLISNCIYFPDSSAPTDSARHLHIGMLNGVGGACFPMFWVPEEVDNLTVDELGTGTFAMRNTVPMSLGQPFRVPFYCQEWDRDGSSADVLKSPLQLKFMMVFPQRWKHFEVRDLQA